MSESDAAKSHAAKSKAEIEAELEGSSDAIHGRLQAIQDEVASTGQSVRTLLRKHPLASVGGSLLAGALLGWLVAGVGRRRLSRAHRALLRQYVQALQDEVRAAVAEGEEVGVAVQEALRSRAPLIVYGRDEDRGGWLRQAAGMVVDTAFALMIREVLSGLLDGLGLDEVVPDAADGLDDESASDTAPDTTSVDPIESSAS